jgi:acyl-CoA synthetase (AMP-forming)/AMP-acid ligase II
MPWENEFEILGVPKTLEPYPERPVASLLERAARIFPKTGFIQQGRLLSYPEAWDHARRLAAALAAFGLVKGDRVATILPTSVQFALADYAISLAGLAHVPSTFLEPEKNLIHKFKNAAPKALFTMVEHLDLALRVSAGADLRHIIVSDLADYSAAPPPARPDLSAPGAVWFTDLVASHPPEPPELSITPREDLETLLFTGGTTGLPKGCMITHRHLLCNISQALDGFGGPAARAVEGAVSVLLGIPFYHSYGHIMMHLFTRLGANQILVPDPRDTKGIVAMIRAHRPVMLMGVPTQFLNLAREEPGGCGMLGMSGSAPLPSSTHEAYEEKSGGSLVEGYGLSEMGPVAFLNPSLIYRLAGGTGRARRMRKILAAPGLAPVANAVLRKLGPRVVGQAVNFVVARKVRKSGADPELRAMEKRGAIGIPLPDSEIRLLDVTTGKELSREQVIAGERGELCLKGPHAMLGYWPEPGSGKDPEGFVHTGDVVVMDQRGYFTIVDRVKDMIIVSGYKVYSREIEDILYQHPGVVMAAAVGAPDPDREGSERPVVFVVPNPAYPDVTEDGITAWLRERVAKYAVPKRVCLLTEFPLTAVQKIDKKVLRAMAQKEFAKEPVKGNAQSKA